MNVDQHREPEVPALSRLLRALCLYGLAGASSGLAMWALRASAELPAYVALNKLAPESRHTLLLWIGVGMLTGLGSGALVARLRGLARSERLAFQLSPLALIGLVPYLAQYKLWLERDLSFLVLVAAFSVGLQKLLRASIEAGAFTWIAPAGQRLRDFKRLPTVLAMTAAAAYAVYFSVVTTTSHYNFCTSAFDLGLEDNLLWNTVHGGPLFRSTPLGGSMLHGGFHQTYFAFVIGLVYRFVPRAETLLVIQSVFLGAAVVPLYLIARPRIGPLTAALMCCLYVFYAPTHGANLYDFHYQPLGVFFVLLVFYLIENRHDLWAVPVVLLTLSVREDMGAMLGGLGAYIALSSRPRAGLVLAAVGGTYFVALKLFIMPIYFMHGESSFAHIYAQLVPDGEQGFGGVLKTLVGNPGYVVGTLLTQDKLVYALQIFAPLAFLPLRRSIALVLLLPATFFTLLSTGYPAVIMTTFQYTAYWTPMLFLSAVFAVQAIARVERQGMLGRGSKHAWLCAMTVAMLLTSNRYGVIFQQETARGAFDPVRLSSTSEDHKNHADFTALAARVPHAAKVVAAEWLISHVSNRKYAYSLRFGVMDAEYLLFWLHPTKLRPDERPVLRAALFGKGEFGVVEQRGMFVLARRGYDQTLNKSLRHKF